MRNFIPNNSRYQQFPRNSIIFQDNRQKSIYRIILPLSHLNLPLQTPLGIDKITLQLGQIIRNPRIKFTRNGADSAVSQLQQQ